MLALLLALGQGGPVDLPGLLDELVDRAALARFPDPPYRARMSSSASPLAWSPAGDPRANDDVGHFQTAERAHPGGPHVLLDAVGPGAITRIWSPNPRGRIQVFIDDEDRPDASPAIEADMRALLTGRDRVPSPLASERGGAAVAYLPIPFARRALVTADDPGALAYQVEWRSYAPGTRVTSFVGGDLARHADAIARANAAWSRAPAALGVETFRYHVSAEAPEGELLATSPIQASESRAVTEIRLRVDARDPDRALTTSTLVLEFDGEVTARVPLGAFFGAHGDFRPIANGFQSVTPPGDLVARFVMPYRESFALRIENAGDPELHLSGTVRTIPWVFDERSLHFHATWRASGPVATRPMRLLPVARVRGRGVLVGDVLAIANPVSAWWGDGDERVTIDGEPTPSHPGTGVPGLYGIAAGDTTLFQAALHGVTRRDGPGDFGRTDLHRFRALDAIPFERDLEYVQELWHSADTVHERTTCAYYYARPGATDDRAAIPSEPEARVPRLLVERRAGAVEAESARIHGISEGLEHAAGVRSGARCSGGLQRSVGARRAGDFIELEIPCAPGRRTVRVFMTRGPDHGILRFAVDGRAIPTTYDGRAAEGADEGPVEVDLGTHDVAATLVLRVEVAGTSVTGAGPRGHFGIDAVVVR